MKQQQTPFKIPKLITVKHTHEKKTKECVLTFTNRSPVHYPDQGRTIFTVGRDAVLGCLKDVTVVLFHLRQ